MQKITTTLTDTLKFPESPRWFSGSLWCCDLYAQRVVRVDLDGNVETVVELEDTPTGLSWTPQGQLLVVSANARRLFRVENGVLAQAADLSELVAYPLNDMTVDSRGRAYVGSLGYDFGDYEAEPQPGPILLVTPEGSAQIVAEGLAFPNGMVISPDGQTLIVAESHGARLTAFDIVAAGLLSNRRVWAEFGDPDTTVPPESQITPDGICLDADGAVWVTSPNTREVLRVYEGGRIAQSIPVGSIPLACMLGGSQRRTLFIATTDSFNPEDSDARGRIEMLEVDIPGAGLP